MRNAKEQSACQVSCEAKRACEVADARDDCNSRYRPGILGPGDGGCFSQALVQVDANYSACTAGLHQATKYQQAAAPRDVASSAPALKDGDEEHKRQFNTLTPAELPILYGAAERGATSPWQLLILSEKMVAERIWVKLDREAGRPPRAEPILSSMAKDSSDTERIYANAEAIVREYILALLKREERKQHPPGWKPAEEYR